MLPLLLLFLFPICNAVETPLNRGYVFITPRVYLAGETESGCLSLHNLEGPAHVTLELLTLSSIAQEEILTSTSTVLKTGIETCLELVVPTTTRYNSGKLRLKATFDKYPDYTIDDEKKIYIEHDSLLVFVETDKPIYKPGQDVNVRIVVLKHDLKPWKKMIPKVWIENPSEIKVALWTNLTMENGMVQLQFPLSSEPSPGTWKIKVETKKSHRPSIQTTVFEVKKYVLPRFQLTISSPGYILADAENVTWNICAKYSYGKPVKGTLLLKSSPQTPIWRRKLNLPEIHYETGLDSPNGCTKFTLSGTVLGLADWKVAPNSIVFIANFTEAGTGVVETSISRTMVVHQALKLEFLPYTSKYFKLGLPYHGKLRVVRQDGTPEPNAKIQLCLRVQGKDEWLRVVVECRNFTSSLEGFVDFIVPPSHRNIVLLNFVATAIDYPTKYYSPDKRWRIFMDNPSTYINVIPWYSPSDSYLSVARGYQPIVCGEKYSFNVMYTTPANNNNETILFHYSINSKGDLLIYGHIKHRASRESILNYSEFRNLLGAVDSLSNRTEETSMVQRFPLSVKITPSMAPVSQLLLYYVRSDGEVVATSYTIEVGHCFENKVKTAWHTEVQTPGSMARYHVEAAPWSLCGISAIDKSSSFLTGSKTNLMNATQTFDRLKRFHPEAETQFKTWSECSGSTPVEGNGEEVDHLPLPIGRFRIALPLSPAIRRRRRHMFTPTLGMSRYFDASQAFNDFRVIVMSDLILETRSCQHLLSDKDGRWIFTKKNAYQRISNVMPISLTGAVAAAAMSPELEYVDQTPDQTSALRSYFPETWLWELVPVGREGKVTIERLLPHTITEWIGHTICVSSTHGLGIAPPAPITAFQPFFLDYNLPYSVKRGELLRLKVSLFNYMHHSLPVKITLEDANGFELQERHKVEFFCAKPRESVIQEYLLKPRLLGELNVTVSASIDSDYPEFCGPETVIYIRDVIVKPILVIPEGFPVEVTRSAFICPKEFKDDIISWNLDLPEDLIPESARAYVTLTGDILGPALENLDNLVRLPVGCGEQNMILFVPNIHVIAYLDAINIENSILRAKAIRNMEKGYQRELIYRHPDGSYSAFGPESSESESSIWLTGFVVKSFAQARSMIYVDEKDLKASVKWIVKKQLENGCFPVIGRVFHKEMKGGMQEDSSPALTAYILISLLESGVPLAASLVNNALHCLEKGMQQEHHVEKSNPYTLALSTYALALLEHPKANDSMKLMMELVTRHNDLLWWEDKSKPWMSLSIEMTAYAVLSLIKIGGEPNMLEASKAVRWMSKQRNAEGGFASTQDTVLGLEALTKYARAMFNNNTDLAVLVTAGDMDYPYRMHNDNRMILNKITLPVLPTVLEVLAEGDGCILVQSTMKYNVGHATGSEAFDLSVAATSADFHDECSIQKITVCARYKMADEESNMALLEIGMISGYQPDHQSLHQLLEDPSMKVKRFEEEGDILTIYFDKLTGQKTCISFTVIRKDVVDRLEAANVILYDYYQRELKISSSYNFAETCSSSAGTMEEVPNPHPVLVQLQKSLIKDAIILEDKTVEFGSGQTTESSMFNVTTDSQMEGVYTKETNQSHFEGNPSFIVVDHELETPDGMEGPLPVYVKLLPKETNTLPSEPSTSSFDNTAASQVEIIDKQISNVTPMVHFEQTELDLSETSATTTAPAAVTVITTSTTENIVYTSPEIPINKSNESWPICYNELPADISDIYCTASSVNKVAIRRMRKVRLLLDLEKSRYVKRLRSTVELYLNPDCSCAPLDNSGGLALFIHIGDNNPILFHERTGKLILDRSIIIYSLPFTTGVPAKIIEARSVCPAE